MELTVVDDPELAAALAAQRVAAAVAGGGHVSLAGGRTPRRAYELLAATAGIDWSQVDLWFGDERCVPADDPESNYRLVAESLLPGAREARVHPVDGTLPPREGAAAYAEEIRGVTLDLALLGLGEDGHTASLFPDSPALQERSREAVAVVASKPPPNRITLTLPVFEAARDVVVLAVGEGKAAAVAAVLRGPDPQYPASLLPAHAHLVVDRAAAPRATS
ncbi:MAG: 6-phosphogluconolactonase [Gaiellales bacterium]